MANPNTLTVDTVLYCVAEPKGRMFPAGHDWPGDAWTAQASGKPSGENAAKGLMKDLEEAASQNERLGMALASKDHDLALMAAARDEANGKVAGLEQRAIAAEKGQVEADERAAEYMRERDAARSDFQRVSDQFVEVRAASEESQATIERLTAELATANQALATANGEIEGLKAEIAKVDGDSDGKVGGSKAKASDKT